MLKPAKKLKIEIHLGNDDMQTWYQVCDSIKHALSGIDENASKPDKGFWRSISDINGNIVGTITTK